MFASVCSPLEWVIKKDKTSTKWQKSKFSHVKQQEQLISQSATMQKQLFKTKTILTGEHCAGTMIISVDSVSPQDSSHRSADVDAQSSE